jgi:hypothetical protein
MTTQSEFQAHYKSLPTLPQITQETYNVIEKMHVEKVKELSQITEGISKHLIPDFFNEFMAYVQNVKYPIEYFDIEAFKMRAITKYIYLPLSSLHPWKKAMIDHKIEHGILQRHVESEHKQYISTYGERPPSMMQDFYNWQYNQVLQCFEAVFKCVITPFFDEFEQYKQSKRCIMVRNTKPFHEHGENNCWAYETNPINPSWSFMVIASVLIHNNRYLEYIKNYETMLKIVVITTQKESTNDTQTNG